MSFLWSYRSYKSNIRDVQQSDLVLVCKLLCCTQGGFVSKRLQIFFPKFLALTCFDHERVVCKKA